MNTFLLDTDKIDIVDRVRKDYGDLDKLAESITRFGLIQPIVVTPRGSLWLLVNGGRRLAAAFKLGWKQIPAVSRIDMSDAEVAELELEENVRRKDMTWQERVRSIAKVHYSRSKDAVLSQQEWGYEQTGELLGVFRSDVHYALVLDLALARNDKQLAECDSINDALQLLAARKEAEAERVFLSKRVDIITPTGHVIEVKSNEDPTFAASGFVHNLVVKLADAIEWLEAQPLASLDHIYTDPPYGIDMDNLQGEDGIGMNVSDVRATHQVGENLDLLSAFLRIAPTRLKPSGFLVMWCDFVYLDWLTQRCDLRSQRWPLLWVKTSPCQNRQANSNFTKATECAMLFAGPQAVLAKPAPTNYWLGASDKGEHNPTNTFWKPLGLHRWVLSHIALAGTCICDPFAGSGSIPLAAIGLGYDCIAIEKDQKHYLDMCNKLKVH